MCSTEEIKSGLSTNKQREEYGEYAGSLSVKEFSRYFYLDDAGHKSVAARLSVNN